jgi:photoactive yellow protein
MGGGWGHQASGPGSRHWRDEAQRTAGGENGSGMEQGVEHLDLAFEGVELPGRIGVLTSGDLDLLEFGVIGFDGEGRVRDYNTHESSMAGLTRERVVGRLLFSEVAPCMGNAMVAGRFTRAASNAEALDAILDYVLTLRMRPVRVRLRLLADPGAPLRYLLVQRLP